MKKKDVRWSFRPTLKTQVYLQALGFIDGRSGRKRDKTMNLSDFINKCIVIVCEADKISSHPDATSDELRKAWQRFAINERQRKANQLYAECHAMKKADIELEVREDE